jgi:hypothetical protein
VKTLSFDLDLFRFDNVIHLRETTESKTFARNRGSKFLLPKTLTVRPFNDGA